MAETEESLKKGRRADWGRWTVAGPTLNTGRPALVFKECATAGRPAVSDWAGLPRRAPSRASRRGSLVKTTETRCNPAGPTAGRGPPSRRPAAVAAAAGPALRACVRFHSGTRHTSAHPRFSRLTVGRGTSRCARWSGKRGRVRGMHGGGSGQWSCREPFVVRG